MPITPYNTGKVKIGCHYVPPQQNINTPETDQWQRVFLRDQKECHAWVWFYVMAAVGFALGYWGLR